VAEPAPAVPAVAIDALLAEYKELKAEQRERIKVRDSTGPARAAPSP
jgi:hypothetical protein